MAALLYLLGALATLQTFIIGGYWREARGDTTGVVCIALLCAAWPIYVTCVTLNVLRMLKQKKRAKQGALVTKEKKEESETR